MIDIEEQTEPWTGGTHVVDLPDGHHATMRNMTGKDMLSMGGDDFGDTLRRLQAAVIDHDYGGDLFDQEYEPVIRTLLNGWRVGTRESVLPPTNGKR